MKFDDELEALQKRIAEMAERTEAMVSLAAAGIKDRTRDVHTDIASNEARLDQMQTEIDREAIRLLTVYGPVATDLRYVLVVNHVTAQLERIGDQVVNVCEALELMQSDPEHGVLRDLHKMADLVCEIVSDAVTSFFDKDAVKAETTRSHDDLVDALNAQVVKKLLSDELLHEVIKGTSDIADALAQILMARHFERIADQAVNICKEVQFLVHGEDVRHLQKT